jgi:peptide/nickel transport system permease protein
MSDAFQMILVVYLGYAPTPVNLALGTARGIAADQQSGRFQITEDDIARIRASFELDLYLPIRFTRWFAGWPTGPVVIGGNEYFSDVVVGCRTPVETEVLNDEGEYEILTTGCKELVYMKDLVGRRTSRGLIRGDFGLSWRLLRDRPVSDLIISRLPKTLQLIGLSTLLSLFIGIPLGIYSAVKQYSRFDYIFTSLAFMGSAMPTFFFGIVMILLFSLIPKGAGWPYVPAGLSESVRGYTIPLIGQVAAGSIKDRSLHLILPVAVLTIVNISFYSRFVRGSMLEVMRQDYVRTARAKGLIERVVIMKHALRNALIIHTIVVLPPVYLARSSPKASLPGPAWELYLLALGDYDYPVAMAISLSSPCWRCRPLLRDVLYTVVDPNPSILKR